jgi:multiple sugar transport system permease protein
MLTDRPRKRQLRSKDVIPYFFIAPSLTILLCFSVIPIIQSVRLAFIEYDIINPDLSIFVGLAHFKKLVRDPYMWQALWTTVYYSLGTVLPGIIISLIFALIITEPWFRFKDAARVVIFIPFIVSMTIAGLLWSWLYAPAMGLFNFVLIELGLPQQMFLGDPRLAMPSIMIMVIWKGLGYNITIWSAGILGLHKDFRDAAIVDGASYAQELFRIRLPLLRPVLMFLTVLGFIGSFQSFDAIYILTQGGPMNRTRVLVYYLWQNAFAWMKFSYASTIAWFLFVILVSLTYLQFRSYGREEVIY